MEDKPMNQLLTISSVVVVMTCGLFVSQNAGATGVAGTASKIGAVTMSSAEMAQVQGEAAAPKLSTAPKVAPKVTAPTVTAPTINTYWAPSLKGNARAGLMSGLM
jgi:hypothetical protein